MNLLDKPVLFKDPDYQRKMLFFDIETSPNLGYVWGKWEQNVISFKEHWYILCFSYKWLGEKKTEVVSLPHFKLYKKEPANDRELVVKLWHLFDKAEVLIGQNLDAFDVKKANARFLKHGLEPPSPYKTIDTLKIARKHFKLDSNKLDDLGEYLNIGRKVKTGGFDLWLGCLNKDVEAWSLMEKYCVQDTELLEKVYKKLRGWDTAQKNNLNIVYRANNCPKCQSEHFVRRGKHLLVSGAYQGYSCLNCGHRFRGEKVEDFKPTFR